MERLIRSGLCLFLVILCLPLWCQQGQPFDLSMRQARLFFDAGDYGRARSQYEILFEESMPRWQQAILLYDVGTTFLAQKKWGDALDAFQKSSSLSIAFPLLQQQLAVNQTLAMLSQAQESFSTLQAASYTSSEEIIGTFFFIESAVRQASAADKASCVLQKIEGASICSAPPSVLAMQQQAKILLAAFLRDSTALRLSHLSWSEAMATLLAGEQALVDHLEFLSDERLDEEIRGQYLPIYLKQAESWYVLWDAAEKMLVSRSEETAAKFRKAETTYMDTLTSMRQEKIVKGKELLSQSMELLEALLQESFGENPLQSMLKWLLARYALALTFDPIQETALDAIERIQVKLKELMAATKTKEDPHFLEALQLFQRGKEASATGRLIQTRMFIEGAYSLLGMVETGPEGKKLSVEKILNGGIVAEERALMLNRLRQQVEEEEMPISGVNELLPQSQQWVLSGVSSFFDAVKRQQKEGFRAGSCQCHQWEDVVALFIQGLNAAMQAEHVLAEGASQWVPAADLQQKTIQSWKNALKQLREQRQQQEQENEESEQSQSPSAPKSLLALIKAIQEMEQDDRSHQMLEGRKTQPIQGVKRPW